AAGLYKSERLIAGAQGARVTLKDGRTVINMCANNYLGLADNPEVKAAAAASLEKWGFGVASVRFICGTQTLHTELEKKLSDFLGAKGRGTHEHCNALGRVDLITGTFGKALGGASGGYISGKKECVELLRQHSRPYLFSNSLAPSIVASTMTVLDILSKDTS